MWKIVAGAVGCTSAAALTYAFVTSGPPALDEVTQPAGASVSAQDRAPLGTETDRRSQRAEVKSKIEYTLQSAIASAPIPATDNTGSPIADIQVPKPQRWTLRIVDSDGLSSMATRRATPSPASLTRQIQRQIRRVGCGYIPISGYWDRRTRNATARFVANNNAALPTNAPDVALLSLMRNYHGTKCGQICSGVIDSAGNCIADQQPTLAKAPKVVAPQSTSWKATTWTTVIREAAPAAPTTQRVVVGKHKPTARTAARKSKPNILVTPRRVVRQYAPTPSVTEGRMALGARKSVAPRRGPVTLQQRTFTGPSDVYLQGGEPVDVNRVETLRKAREEYLREQRATKRRKARTRRYRPKKLTWRERAFQSHD